MSRDKIQTDADAALDGVPFDGTTIMSGRFGLSGDPEHPIAAPKRSGVENREGVGGPRFPHRCSLPLAGQGVVDVAIADLAVSEIDRRGGGIRLVEPAAGIDAAEVGARTEADDRAGLAQAA